MKFCRIDLSKTNYQKLDNVRVLSQIDRDINKTLLHNIYKSYCQYKKFDSVMPLFDSIIFDQHTDIFGYCINESIVAFSIVKRYDADNAESLQFAWDYQDPDARLGIKSIEHECAFYKELGYKYLYLGKVNDYKTQFDGYEQIGNPYV